MQMILRFGQIYVLKVDTKCIGKVSGIDLLFSHFSRAFS